MVHFFIPRFHTPHTPQAPALGSLDAAQRSLIQWLHGVAESQQGSGPRGWLTSGHVDNLKMSDIGWGWNMLEYVGCVLDMFLDFHWYVHPLDWELNGYPPFFFGASLTAQNDIHWWWLGCSNNDHGDYPPVPISLKNEAIQNGDDERKLVVARYFPYVFTIHWGCELKTSPRHRAT